MPNDYVRLLKTRANRRLLAEKAAAMTIQEEAENLHAFLTRQGYSLSLPPLDDPIRLKSYVGSLRKERARF